MKHTYFEIKNFKGISNIRLDFIAQPRSSVYTLVGLNESGKTTILEALNFFSYKAESVS
jgi:AAA15 family ATPase/GTPase